MCMSAYGCTYAFSVIMFCSYLVSSLCCICFSFLMPRTVWFRTVIDECLICHSCDGSSRLRACLQRKLNGDSAQHFSTNLCVSSTLKPFTQAYLSFEKAFANHRLKPWCCWKVVSEYPAGWRRCATHHRARERLQIAVREQSVLAFLLPTMAPAVSIVLRVEALETRRSSFPSREGGGPFPGRPFLRWAPPCSLPTAVCCQGRIMLPWM